MKEFYSEVVCNYLDEDSNFWTVDAWRTGKGDEEGKVIAVIHDPDGDVHYCEPEAIISPMAQEVIKEKVAEIRASARWKVERVTSKEEALEVINEIIDESTKAMRKEAEKLLDAQSWEFDTFKDRNTFARTVMEVIFDKEKKQYQAINNTKAYKTLKANLAYELGFIHI